MFCSLPSIFHESLAILFMLKKIKYLEPNFVQLMSLTFVLLSLLNIPSFNVYFRFSNQICQYIYRFKLISMFMSHKYSGIIFKKRLDLIVQIKLLKKKTHSIQN